MVERLEQLRYGAESRRKIVSSRLGFAIRDWKSLSVNPEVNGYCFFELRKDEAAKGERRALSFICCVQDTVGL